MEEETLLVEENEFLRAWLRKSVTENIPSRSQESIPVAFPATNRRSAFACKPRKQSLAKNAHSAANTASCSAYETAVNVAHKPRTVWHFPQAETKTAFETVDLKTLVCGVNFSGSAKSDPDVKSKVSKKVPFSKNIL